MIPNFQFKEHKLKKMIFDICYEHWEISKKQDSNIAYLWYLYTEGTKAGTFKPFMFLAELNLLVKTGYITEEEKNNMIQMFDSSDEDNIYMLAYSILNFRNKRVNDMGLWTLFNAKYSKIDYIRDIINPELFMKN